MVEIKIPKVLKRGKEESIDQIIQENVRGTEEEEKKKEEERPIEVKGDEAVRKFSMDVDKLKAGVESLRQMNQLNEQRFQKISEEFGDLRRSGVEREKEVNKLRLDAKRAADLVSSVQPEKLRMMIEKEDAKIEKLKAMQEANKKLIDYMSEEAKKIRKDTEAFRGVESVIKLNEEAKEELANVKKVELTIEKHADKVEQMFITMQKRFNEFLKLSDKFNALEKSFNEVMKRANKFQVEFDELVKKEELTKIENSMDEKLKAIDKLKEELTKSLEQVNEILPRLKSLDKLTEDIKASKYITEEKLDKDLDEFYKSIIEKLESYKKEIDSRLFLEK